MAENKTYILRFDITTTTRYEIPIGEEEIRPLADELGGYISDPLNSIEEIADDIDQMAHTFAEEYVHLKGKPEHRYYCIEDEIDEEIGEASLKLEK